MKSGWEMATLGEVCHVYQPQTLAQKALRQGPHPVFGANGQIGWHSEFNHENEELVLGCRGSVGSVHVTPRKTWINGNAMVVRPKDSRISIELLKYAFLGGIKISDAISGTAQPQITRTSLSPLTICFPTAKAEQYQLTKKLDKAFAGLAKAKENAERNLQNARALFESYLEYVLTQSGKGWVKKELGELCEFENGDRGTNYPNKSARTASGIPFINAGHLTEFGLDMENMDFISEERFKLLGSGKIRPKDILFCLRGSLGKFASVGEISSGAIASSLVIIRPKKDIIDKFLLLYFSSRLCAEMIGRFKNGAAQPNLSANSLKKFIIFLPPIAEQEAISQQVRIFVAEIQRFSILYRQKQAALDALKKSILHEAFSGNL